MTYNYILIYSPGIGAFAIRQYTDIRAKEVYRWRKELSVYSTAFQVGVF